MINGCPECLKKQREIDTLREELQRLKQRLRYQERQAKEGFFGSSTPSSKIPVKPNTAETSERKARGAHQGHPGAGRQGPSGNREDPLTVMGGEGLSWCPDCGAPLLDKGYRERLVMESRPLQAEKVVYRLTRRYCPRCRKLFQVPAPGVLPKSLYGNQLIATAAVMHYLHGTPLNRVCEQVGVGAGSLVDLFRRVAKLFGPVIPQLMEEYRQFPVKHADETGWRTDGQNGYAWLFATIHLSLFLFRDTRSAKVPQSVLGELPLPGTLVVDRYAGYNKVPCCIHYCYAHLLREIEDLKTTFPDSSEVNGFVSVMAPLLSTAMNLRTQPIDDATFYAKAVEVKRQILDAIEAPATHLAIQRIQDIFRSHPDRLYRWAENRRIPADNNLAERDLRPTVIARKVSFGSVSDAGAQTRGTLMSVLFTLKKRCPDVTLRIKEALDRLSADPRLAPYSLLFPQVHSLPP